MLNRLPVAIDRPDPLHLNLCECVITAATRGLGCTASHATPPPHSHSWPIAAAGVAHAQMQAPSTPEGRDGRSMPGATSNPNTGLPKSPMNPSAAEAEAKAELEKKGYTGVKSLTRDPAGNWAGKAMRNNVEIAVSSSPMATSESNSPQGSRPKFRSMVGRFTPGLRSPAAADQPSCPNRNSTFSTQSGRPSRAALKMIARRQMATAHARI